MNKLPGSRNVLRSRFEFDYQLYKKLKKSLDERRTKIKSFIESNFKQYQSPYFRYPQLLITVIPVDDGLKVSIEGVDVNKLDECVNDLKAYGFKKIRRMRYYAAGKVLWYNVYSVLPWEIVESIYQVV